MPSTTAAPAQNQTVLATHAPALPRTAPATGAGWHPALPPKPSTPGAPAHGWHLTLSRDLIMGSLLLLVVAGVIALVGIAVARARPGERAAAGFSALQHAVIFVVMPYAVVATWAYRLDLLEHLSGLTRGLAFLWLAFRSWPQSVQLEALGIVALICLEVGWFNAYKLGYKVMYRSIFPDLVLVSDASAPSNVIGRAYTVTLLEDGKTFRIRYAAKGRGAFQVFKSLRTLETAQEPDRVGRYELRLIASDLCYRGKGVWGLTNDGIDTVPVGSETNEQILTGDLDLSQLVSKKGLEGNPSHLASRARERGAPDTTTISSWVPRKPSPADPEGGSP